MLKLNAITFDKAPLIPGLRAGDMVTLKCDEPTDAMRGWRALLRGPSLFLVSPPGWKPGSYDRGAKPDEPRRIHEVPRVNCLLHWLGGEDDVDKMTKHTTPPFGMPAEDAEPRPGSLLAQVPGFEGRA